MNGDVHTGPRLQELPNTGDPQLDRAVLQWLSWDRNPQTREQIRSLLVQNQVSELRSRLGSRLSFGTAGLRAKMGAGFNRINDLTVIQASQGLYTYLSRCVSELKDRGVVIGFDTRAQRESGCSSESLAKLAASVFLTKDVPVHLFSSYVPTPFVPYAVIKLRAAAGIMITASHNPKEDNGYKVYWSSGAQICSPHDKQLLQCIQEELQPWSATCWSLELSASSPHRTDPLHNITQVYMTEVRSLCFYRDLNAHSPLKFVHTSFHGVGHEFVQQVFQVFGLDPPIPVPEQRDPDPDFSTVSVPNPEEGAAVLELALRLAVREDARVVLATDPDADRLAVAERSDSGEWRVFSGNEMAALLGWWMLLNHRRTHPDTQTENQVQTEDQIQDQVQTEDQIQDQFQTEDQNQDQVKTGDLFMLATTVSSKILQTICSKEGLCFQETLPGFKWIGNRIHELLKSRHRVLFSFEESIGFLCGSMVPEKDGVSAAAVVAEMASYLHQNHLSLSRQLLTIYHTYGFHISNTSYVVCNDPDVVNRIFSRIRNFSGARTYPATCGNIRILNIRDATTGHDSRQSNQRAVLPMTRSSHMITLWLQNGVVATLRTSGTEPKIKIYTEICTEPGSSRCVSELEVELQNVTESLLDLLEPEKNQLIRPSI